MPGSPAPDVDVVVLTHNNVDMVGECLDRLRHEAPVASVVVVDNASSDGTPERLGRRDDIELVSLDRHTGLAAALNRGAARGTAPFVLFLNDDILARPGSVTALRASLGGRSDAVAAGGRLVDPGSDRTQRRYLPKRFPTPSSIAVRLTGIDRLWARQPAMGWNIEAFDDRRPSDVPQPAGAALLVRRDALQAIGGWHEGYSFWLEDVDLSFRLSRIGASLYVPQAAFEHLGGATVGRWDKAEQHRRTYHGVLVYSAAHFTLPGRALVATTVAAVASLRLMLRVRTPAARAAYAAALREAGRALADACRR